MSKLSQGKVHDQIGQENAKEAEVKRIMGRISDPSTSWSIYWQGSILVSTVQTRVGQSHNCARVSLTETKGV